MFRFSIREMMLVTLVVAMGISWITEHRALGEAKKEAAVSDEWRKKREGEIKEIEGQLEKRGLEINWVCWGQCPVIRKASTNQKPK